MQRKFGFVTLIVAVAMCCTSAGAQMVVHAVSGMVKAVNPDSKTMDVTVDNGDTSHFKLPSKAKVTLDFDKALQSDSVNASSFQHVGDYAVVYYYGYGNDQTAVAVKDLGAGPFQKIEGTVVSFDKHDRTMTVKDDGGKSAVFALDDHLVVDSGMSVASGRGYDPHKGYHVIVTYTQAGDKNSAVFIRSRQ
jgi:hypothetical protein